METGSSNAGPFPLLLRQHLDVLTLSWQGKQWTCLFHGIVIVF
jgi:hypothetical protein